MPQILTDLPSNWCAIAPRPHLMTGFFREWFKYHFSDEANIEHKELRYALWKAMPDTKILVESITQWDPASVQRRPAIIIKRNDWQVQRAGIDDRLMGGVSLKGERHYATFVTGSHTLFCIAGKGAEAEILAAEVFREMVQFGPVIRQELELMRFVVAGEGAMFELDEARENYAVPVTVTYAAEERWKLVQQAPVLKKIVLSSYLP